MGRTVPSYRQSLNREVASWSDFRRGLSPGDQAIFDELMDMARHTADAGSLAARPVVLDSVFMSILVELLGRVRDLEATVRRMRRDQELGGGALDA